MAVFHVDHVHIYTQDIDRTVQFYKDVFDAVEIRNLHGKNGLLVHLDLGGVRVVVSESIGSTEGLGHFAISTGDLDKATSKLKELNIDTSELGVAGRFQNVFIKDPTGTVIELISPSTKA